MDVKLEVGKTYKVNHARKGTFLMVIESVDAEFANGRLATGSPSPHYVATESRLSTAGKLEGDPINVRLSLSTFEPVEVLEKEDEQATKHELSATSG